MRYIRFGRLIGATLITFICAGIGCGAISDAKSVNLIRSCGIEVRRVDDSTIEVDLIDSQGDTELARIVPHLRNLEERIILVLKNTKTTDAGLASLKGLNNIKVIWLDHTKVTDAGMDSIRSMSGLKILSLTGTTVTDSTINRLKRVRPDFDIQKVTAAQERAIKAIDELNNPLFHPSTNSVAWWGGGKLIGLRLDGVADVDLSRLREHLEALNESLQELHLSGNGVTDVGLSYIKSLSHLRRLTLVGTTVTDAGVRKLRQASPQLELLRLEPSAPLPPALPPP